MKGRRILKQRKGKLPRRRNRKEGNGSGGESCKMMMAELQQTGKESINCLLVVKSW